MRRMTSFISSISDITASEMQPDWVVASFM